MYLGDKIRFRYVADVFPSAPKDKDYFCLDLGCGAQFHRVIAETQGFKYVGMDKSPGYRGTLKIDLNDEEDILKLVNAKKGFYSVVLCIDVLEHLKNPFLCLTYLPDLLSEDGRLIVHVPNKNQTHILVEPEKNLNHTRDGFSKDEIKNCLGKFFAPDKFYIMPTFLYNEAIAWDLNHIFSYKEYLIREALFEAAISRILHFDIDKFIPYGMLIIGDK